MVKYAVKRDSSNYEEVNAFFSELYPAKKYSGNGKSMYQPYDFLHYPCVGTNRVIQKQPNIHHKIVTISELKKLIEMNEKIYTLEDLRDGRVVLKHNGDVALLQKVIKEAFSTNVEPRGDSIYYYTQNKRTWISSSHPGNLPVQCATKFAITQKTEYCIEKGDTFEYMKSTYTIGFVKDTDCQIIVQGRVINSNMSITHLKSMLENKTYTNYTKFKNHGDKKTSVTTTDSDGKRTATAIFYNPTGQIASASRLTGNRKTGWVKSTKIRRFEISSNIIIG